MNKKKDKIGDEKKELGELGAGIDETKLVSSHAMHTHNTQRPTYDKLNQRSMINKSN